jgi:hypothetical protein
VRGRFDTNLRSSSVSRQADVRVPAIGAVARVAAAEKGGARSEALCGGAAQI